MIIQNMIYHFYIFILRFYFNDETLGKKIPLSSVKAQSCPNVQLFVC